MIKLNEYLQAEKMNSINVEGLYGDLIDEGAVLVETVEEQHKSLGGALRNVFRRKAKGGKS